MSYTKILLLSLQFALIMDPPRQVQFQTLVDTGRSKLLSRPNFCCDIFSELNALPFAVEPPIFVWNEMRKQNRDVIFLSDESKGYKYSGQFMASTPLKDYPLMTNLLQQVNANLNTHFNGMLINRYTDGSKYLSDHSDAEEALDNNNKMVAGIAFGAVRRFVIKNRGDKKVVLDHLHQPGELLIMAGDFQSEFTHGIPKQLRVKDCRISVTFRKHNY